MNSTISQSVDAKIDKAKMARYRSYCFRLIKEVVVGRLGWKFFMWVPAVMLVSTVQLLPPQFLKFFTSFSLRDPSESVKFPAWDLPGFEIQPGSFIFSLILFGVAIAACQWLASFLSGLIYEYMRLTVSVELRRDSIKAVNRTRVDKLDLGHRGEWMTRTTGDLRSCETFLTYEIANQIREATMLLCIAVILFSHSFEVGIALVISAVAMLGFNTLVQKFMGPTLKKARDIEADIVQSMIESFEGLRTIRSYGAEDFMLRRINVQLKNLFQTGMRVMKAMAGLMGLNGAATQLVVTGVLAYAYYDLTNSKAGSHNDILDFVFYVMLFLGSANGLARSIGEWNRFFIEGGSLAELLYDKEGQIPEESELFGGLQAQVSQVKKISVSDLSVAYGDHPPVIHDFDFELNSGEIVAIMGPSGCGKSTFLESFSGLRQANEGVFSLNLGDLEQKYSQAPVFLSAFVEQQPYLFVGTVRENISMGNSDLTDDDLWVALRQVGLEGIFKQRGGLNEVLADRGRNLSVGQQYRLALCRALVSKRPFLFLDEPFAALDPESIELVIEAIQLQRENGVGIAMISHILPGSLAPESDEAANALAGSSPQHSARVFTMKPKPTFPSPPGSPKSSPSSRW